MCAFARFSAVDELTMEVLKVIAMRLLTHGNLFWIPHPLLLFMDSNAGGEVSECRTVVKRRFMCRQTSWMRMEFIQIDLGERKINCVTICCKTICDFKRWIGKLFGNLFDLKDLCDFFKKFQTLQRWKTFFFSFEFLHFHFLELFNIAYLVFAQLTKPFQTLIELTNLRSLVSAPKRPFDVTY